MYNRVANRDRRRAIATGSLVSMHASPNHNPVAGRSGNI